MTSYQPKARLVLALLFYSASAIGQTYSISGTLKDVSTGEPIEDQGEGVCLRNTDGEGFGCTQPEAGIFSFEQLPEGDYILFANADGYVSGLYSGFVADACGSGGKGTPISVGPDAVDVDLELQKGVTVEGTVLAADGNPTRLAYIDISAIDHNEYCGFERLEVVENGQIQTPNGWGSRGALLAGTHVLSAIPIGPGAPAHVLVTGQPGDHIENIIFQLGGDTAPRVSDLPPVAELISLTAPDADHLVQVTGLSGAAQPDSAVILYNLDVGNFAITRSNAQGGFATDLFAPWGSLILVKQDPTLRYLSILDNEFAPSPELKPLPGTLLFQEQDQDNRFFQQVGPTDPLPAWQVSASVNTTQVAAGGTVLVTGTMKLLSNLPGANPSVGFPNVDLTRITSADGKQIIPRGRFASTRITATDLPIEYNCCPTDRVDGFDLPFTETSPGTWEGEINTSFEIPATAQPGLYQAWLNVDSIQLAINEPPNSDPFVPGGGSNIPLPLIRVGEPAPPRMFLHLLSNHFHNGSRGIRAVEDRQSYGMSTNMGTSSDVFVVPKNDPISGQPVSYNLEPFVPQALWSERSHPARRMPLFRFPSGRLTIDVTAPSGMKTSLGPSEFEQLSFKSPAKSDGNLIDHDGQHATNITQLRTMNPQYDVQFNEYGKHTISIDMNIDDISGNKWTGAGTFEVWVARPLVVDTTVFPGMSFQQGDTLSTGVTVSPAGPAQVEYQYVIAPDSIRANRENSSVSGLANRFGQFQQAGIELDKAGEYRVDVTASYTDDEGVLWMGSRTWGGVVARPDPPIIAHGKRVIDKSPEIGPQWFTRVGLGEPEGDSHIPPPFSSGDIQWVHESDAAVPLATIQDLTGGFEDIFLNRLTEPGVGPGSLEEQIAVGEIPLTSGGLNGVEPHMNPELTDLWSYSYRTSQRPLVRVRELISESSIRAYWRFNEQYHRQVGVGLDGDRLNEIKFQYAGAVVRGDALARPEYAIHGSLFVMVPPPGDGEVGTRTFPPFQGNGGGPSGGPIITHKGEDIEILINLRAMRPGSIYEVGDTFSLAGAIGPTLPGKVSYTVTTPNGEELEFSGQANPVGYYYQADDDFVLTVAGKYTVDLSVLFDGLTSAGQVTQPFPTGDVLGSDNGRFYFYVVDKEHKMLTNNLPRESLFEPKVNHDFRNARHFTINIETMLPAGHSVVQAHVTTMMPGTILESRVLNISEPLLYTLDVSELGQEVPNLDWENGLADLLTTSIFVETRDPSGEPVYLGKIINFHGAQIFNLDVLPMPVDPPIFKDSFE